MTFAAGSNKIQFTSFGQTIVGNLYVPKDAGANNKHAAIVVGGPGGTVKEQAAGVFAQALSTKEFIALAFDYRTFGESGGTPRQYEDPASKMEDIQTAISYLGTPEDGDNQNIGALGICLSSSFIADALRSDRRVKVFATVSGHFSMREFLLGFATDEQKQQMYAASNAARQHYFETGEAKPNDMMNPDLKEVPPAEAGPFAADLYDYYHKRGSNEWPNYSNHMAPFSFEQIARSHALDYADQITCPYLGIVGETAVTRPLTERFIAAKAQGTAAMKIIEGGRHVTIYDKPEYVSESVDALNEFYKKHLTA